MKYCRRIFLLISMLCTFPVLADPLSGGKVISLSTPNGEQMAVGRIQFSADGDASKYEILWDEAPFTDHFLSMRPFRCIEGPDKNWCYVPYPYENRRRVTKGNLVDLEYDLLFIWKGATDYGINMWNGVYYKLEIDGEKIVGRLHEMNMDVLSAPPPAGELRPVESGDIHETEPESHWLPVVIIE